jgi:hypothetical protein
VTVDGSPTTTNYTYNEANQLTSDGTHTYTLDVQPELWKVLAAMTDGDTMRYIHGPLGLQSQQGPDEAWPFPVVDALGSVCGVAGAGRCDGE